MKSQAYRAWPVFVIASLALIAVATAIHGSDVSSKGAMTRILFVGNSYSGGQGGVADLVRRTAAARGISVEVAQISPGGYTLQDHWSNTVGTRDRIAEGWDWVILQEQSTRPINNTDLFHTYARLLDMDIRAAGGRTAFFLTWAREYAPTTQENLNDAYCAIAEELSARVVPVGMAWALSRERDSGLALHSADDSHQNDAGQYLLGMSFHRRLWDDPPTGLPHDISPNVDVTPAEAEFLQQIAVDAPWECSYLIFEDDFEGGTTGGWTIVELGLARTSRQSPAADHDTPRPAVQAVSRSSR